MEVYADVLVFLNVFVNYFLLLAVKKILKCEIKRKRIFLGAFLGGLYSLSIFFQDIPNFLRVILNISVLSLLVLVSFNTKSFKMFVKQFLCFLLANFIFAGIMLAVWLFFRPSGMIYNNNIIYFNIDLKLLVISTVVCYFVLSVIFRFAKRAAPKDRIIQVTLCDGENTIAVNALVDTGNTLTDSFSGKPVAIADVSVFKKLLGDSLDTYFDFEITDRALRIIPVNTVHSSGTLRATVIDSMTVDSQKLTVNKIILAQSKTKFSSGEYSLILNEEIFREYEGNKENDKTKNKMLIFKN